MQVDLNTELKDELVNSREYRKLVNSRVRSSLRLLRLAQMNSNYPSNIDRSRYSYCSEVETQASNLTRIHRYILDLIPSLSAASRVLRGILRSVKGIGPSGRKPSPSPSPLLSWPLEASVRASNDQLLLIPAEQEKGTPEDLELPVHFGDSPPPLLTREFHREPVTSLTIGPTYWISFETRDRRFPVPRLGSD